MKYFFLIFFIFTIISCTSQPKEQKLPILGNHDYTATDTVYHAIPDFQFVNQDSQMVSNETFGNQAYVVDFFFTSCPTICPKVKKQMLRIHEKFKEEDQLVLLSHTIDTKRDTVERLKEYANNLGVGTPKWHFVTGNKDEIYEIADDYFSVAIEDADAPGGFDHSGRLILVDNNRHVRAFCNGTDPEKVEGFMKDIAVLMKEMENEKMVKK